MHTSVKMIKIKGKVADEGLSSAVSRWLHSLAYDNRGQPMGDTQIDQDLHAALYLLGFNFSGDGSGELAEIKGDMIIKLVHPLGEELKFVVELPGEKQMTFSVDQYQIDSLAERWQ